VLDDQSSPCTLPEPIIITVPNNPITSARFQSSSREEIAYEMKSTIKLQVFRSGFGVSGQGPNLVLIADKAADQHSRAFSWRYLFLSTRHTDL
jgi:hypothetical protein